MYFWLFVKFSLLDPDPHIERIRIQEEKIDADPDQPLRPVPIVPRRELFSLQSRTIGGFVLSYWTLLHRNSEPMFSVQLWMIETENKSLIEIYVLMQCFGSRLDPDSESGSRGLKKVKSVK